jgi:hypothetical protein
MAPDAQRAADRRIVVYPAPGREPETSKLIDPATLPAEVVERVDAAFAELEGRTEDK